MRLVVSIRAQREPEGSVSTVWMNLAAIKKKIKVQGGSKKKKKKEISEQQTKKGSCCGL